MTIQFDFGIDHEQNLMRMTVGEGPSAITTFMDVEDISKFIAQLSQAQHALVLEATGQKTDLPIDPAIAFSPVAGKRAIGAFEVLRRIAVGVDEVNGGLSALLLSRAGRLSRYLMSPAMAQKLGRGLLDSAQTVPGGQMKQ